jgi:hypothetical protein
MWYYCADYPLQDVVHYDCCTFLHSQYEDLTRTLLLFPQCQYVSCDSRTAPRTLRLRMFSLLLNLLAFTSFNFKATHPRDTLFFSGPVSLRLHSSYTSSALDFILTSKHGIEGVALSVAWSVSMLPSARRGQLPFYCRAVGTFKEIENSVVCFCEGDVRNFAWI